MGDRGNFRKKDPVKLGGTDSIADVIADVVAELEMSKEEALDLRSILRKAYIRNIDALQEAVRSRRLCGLLHPYVAEALATRLLRDVFPVVDLSTEPKVCKEIRNPAKFRNGAVFVHRIAPIPGSTKGRIVCTWALDLGKKTFVSDILTRIEQWTSIPVERMRLVFNGFSLMHTSQLDAYDIHAGDTLYLYTLREPAERAFMTPCCYSAAETSNARDCEGFPNSTAPSAILFPSQNPAGLHCCVGGGDRTAQTGGGFHVYVPNCSSCQRRGVGASSLPSNQITAPACICSVCKCGSCVRCRPVAL